MHLHLRDGAALASVVNHSARRFARAIVMPNLSPPVTTVAEALAYRGRILAALEPGLDFNPLMTIYLTDQTTPDEIRRLAESEHVYAVKYYPAGATTHSEHGVTDVKNVYPVLETMRELNVPLLIHGEVVDPDVDIFDRERVFIERVLFPIMQQFKGLRIVLEHITTREAADFVRNGPSTLAATITPQHLLFNRNALFAHGLRPHYYCLPVLKREEHRRALLNAATSTNPRIFLGTDSAPHARRDKEARFGCAGLFSAPSALELYAEAFEAAGALERLEGFASRNGADFYGLPHNPTRVTLRREDWRIPDALPFGDDEVIPLCAGNICHWKLDGA